MTTDNKTPKKIINEDLCFICAKSETKERKTRIFGRTKVDLPALLSRTLDINIEDYFEYGNSLFVCRSCFTKVTKFTDLEKTLDIILTELKETFSKLSKSKRARKSIILPGAINFSSRRTNPYKSAGNCRHATGIRSFYNFNTSTPSAIYNYK